VWHDIFSLPVPAGEKIVRAVLIYALLVVAFRIFGKRELGQWNTLDLAVLLLVANAVQNGIIGNDESVTGAAIGAATLFLVNSGLQHAVAMSSTVQRVLEGDSTVLIKGGQPLMGVLRRQSISLPELRAIARTQGFDDLGEVETAILETNGTVSMFRQGEHLYHPQVAPGSS
jgi:uncharacterized membrane protein YcaP (DUF421 family)